MKGYYDNTAYNPYASATKVVNELILNGFTVEGNTKNKRIPITKWVKIGTELKYHSVSKHAVLDDIIDGIIADFTVSFRGAQQAEKIRAIMHKNLDEYYPYLI